MRDAAAAASAGGDLRGKINGFIWWFGRDCPFLGTNRVLEMRHSINSAKGLTIVAVLVMMLYYGNFSTPAYMYLAMHGSYGIIWTIKDYVFPDRNWRQMQTPAGVVVSVLVLMGYWMAPYLLISSRVFPSNFRVFLCVITYIFGVTLMIASDCQKFYTLQFRKGLITDGFFARTRNPNYLVR